MKRSRLPRINEQVSMRPEGGDRWETTAVQDVRDGMMAVSTPGPSYGAGHIRPGQRWVVRYFDEMREYRFTARIRSVQRTPVALAWLELPAQVEEIQRRQHVRLPVILPAHVWVEAGEEEGDTPGLPASTVDISAGGVQLRLADALPAAGSYRVAIELAEGPVTARARRVRSVERRLPDGRCHWDYGFAFVEIDPADQDRIVRFIFTEQRRLRRQGLA